MDKHEQQKQVCDHEGWSLGMKAVLRGIFGTDIEVRIKHGGMHEDIEHAKGEVGRMTREAEGLLEAINGTEPKESVDNVEQAFEDMVRDI